MMVRRAVRWSGLATSFVLTGCAQLAPQPAAVEQANDRLVVDFVDQSRLERLNQARFAGFAAAVDALLPAMLRASDPPAFGTSMNAGAQDAGNTINDAGRRGSAERNSKLPVVLDGVVVPHNIKPVQLGGSATRLSNIRMGPGTVHPVVRRVPAGTLLDATAVTGNGWYLLAEEGRVYGYIHGSLFRRQR